MIYLVYNDYSLIEGTEDCMKKVLLCLLLLLSVFSCSLPILRSGQADLEFSLGGVLPNISNEDLQYAAGSRAITPNSLMVEAVITGEGFSRTYKAPVLAATTLIAGLPAFKELTITLEALDFEGIVTTSWTGKATLNPGRNSVRAVLRPVAEVNNYYNGQGQPQITSIPFGKAVFFKHTFTGLSGEQMIYIDTNFPDYLWMGVYNENWEPLDTIAESRGDGWAVVNLDTTQTIYFAVANMRSTGFPPREKYFNIGSKQAFFISINGAASNDASSIAPGNMEKMINELGEVADAAFFITAGNYESSSGYFVLNNSQWVFGGFDPTDWKKRSPRATTIYSNGASPAVMLSGSSLKIMDGITIKTNWLGDVQTPFSYALQATNSAEALIKNCLIEGPAGNTATLSNAGAFNIPTSEIFIELYQTELHGWTLTTSTATSLSGINISGNAILRIIACMVDGGNIISASEGIVQSQAVEAQSGTIYAAASYFWGGVSKNTTNSRAFGFNLADSVSVSIFSSVIGGGYASSSNGIAKTAGFAESDGGDSVEINTYACLIDSGIIESPHAASYSAAVYASQYAGFMRFCGSIFVSSAAKDINGIRTPIFYNAGLPEVNNCVFDGFSNDAYDISESRYTTITDVNNLIRQPGDMSIFFNAFRLPNSYAAFMSNSWRPVGLLANIKSKALPSDWGIEEVGDLEGSFPNLIVDLGNRLRPFLDFWTIGPYQN